MEFDLKKKWLTGTLRRSRFQSICGVSQVYYSGALPLTLFHISRGHDNKSACKPPFRIIFGFKRKTKCPHCPRLCTTAPIVWTHLQGSCGADGRRSRKQAGKSQKYAVEFNETGARANQRINAPANSFGSAAPSDCAVRDWLPSLVALAGSHPANRHSPLKAG
jgi:hypothetical protein